MRMSDWSSDVCSSDLKVAVFTDQELINNILTEAGENSRLVCKRVKRTGSHMSSNQCMTVAARDRAREHAQEQLRHHTPRSLPRAGLSPNHMRLLVIEENPDPTPHPGEPLNNPR